MQCLGRNRDISRCKNSAKFLFCKKHKYQIIVFLLITLPGILLTYYGIYHLFKSNDEEFLPAREAVVSTIFQCYESLNRAAQYSIAPIGKTDRQKFLASKWSLDPIENDLKKAETVIVRNNVALKPKTLSLVSSFMDAARILQKKLTFFAQLHNPEMYYWDFISRGPFEELQRIENTINELKHQFPQITFPDNLKTYEELEEIWKEVEKTNDRILFNAGKYKWKNNRLPMVFDTDDLVKMGGKDGSLVKVYDLNE